MRPGTTGFVPQRLLAAREARGLTATELADLTGVTRQSISAYEKGKQTPSPMVLTRISEKLNLPSAFFLKRPYQRDQNPISFRSLSAATKRARIRAEMRLDWLKETIDYLSQFVDLLPVNVPNFDVGKDPSVLSLEEIEDIAAKCRREFGLGDGPISNMVRLLENHGVIVTRQELNAPKLDAFSKWFSSNGVPIVVLGADKHSAVRSRLDAAHELGHLVLHCSVRKMGAFIKIVEAQAFRFASAFLLPAETFTRDFGFPSLDTLWMLKSKWKVSIGAMVKRCQELGIIDEDHATRLWINYNRRGWKKKEPLDDTLPVEEPVFIRRCIELIVREKVQSREDILTGLSLTDSDVEDLTGLPRGYFRRGTSGVEPLPRLRKPKSSKVDHHNGSVVQFTRKKR